ncbi:MAG: HlyD family efflux transporter periplasmic adaptor subunit, partial [Sinimarinibacterium sp.]
MRSLCGILLLLLGACGGEPAQRYNGYVEGEALRLAPGRAGRLDLLAVQRGATVTPGDALFAVDAQLERATLAEAQARLAAVRARLDDLRKGKRDTEMDVLRAQLAQAQAQRELSAAQLKRQQALFARDAVSREQVDQARSAADRDRARVRELEATLASGGLSARDDALRGAEDEVRAGEAVVLQAQSNLAEKAVKAAVAGSIEDVYYRVGEWIPAGAPVLALLPPQNRKLRFFVPQTVLGSLRLGQPVQASCDGCTGPIAATITFIAASAEY